MLQNTADILKRLKNEQIIANILLRHTVKQCARNYFCGAGFVEVDTPILGTRLDEYTKNQFTVEGKNGSYCLPQSPQLYEQLIVMKSFAKYFQFPHCFRDEQFDPLRTDQAPEFMQIDFEFRTTEAQEVMSVAENLMAEICDALNLSCKRPFSVIDAVECIERYGTDKPDLRAGDENAFLWVVNFPLAERNADGKLTPSHHPFALPVLTGDFSDIRNSADTLRTHSYDLVLNGVEIGGGDLNIHSRKLQEEILHLFGYDVRQFALLLDALEDENVPPHGGMGIGLDRLVMQLSGTNNISDVNFFS